MKFALLAIAGLLSILGSQAQQNLCGAPTYTEEISPAHCLDNTRVKLPYYPDPTKYYNCNSGKPVLTSCQVTGQVFNNAYQECTTCQYYLPAVACSGLGATWNQTCVSFTSAPANVTATINMTTGTTPKTSTSTATTTKTSTTTKTTTTTTTGTTTTAKPYNGPPTAAPEIIPTPPNL